MNVVKFVCLFVGQQQRPASLLLSISANLQMSIAANRSVSAGASSRYRSIAAVDAAAQHAGCINFGLTLKKPNILVEI